MNTIQARPSHSPTVRAAHPSTRSVPARRVGLVDRVALHIGIALVQWSRRTTVAVHHDRRAARVRQELDREQRERQAARTLMLTLMPR